jgi:hypothetical protein
MRSLHDRPTSSVNRTVPIQYGRVTVGMARRSPVVRETITVFSLFRELVSADERGCCDELRCASDESAQC